MSDQGEDVPQLDSDGFLPPGIYVTTLGEVRSRFGQFQESDRRVHLFRKLSDYVELATRAGCVVRLLIDGSFVTGKAAPGDIDLIVVVHAAHDFSVPPTPDAYNTLSKKRVNRAFGFDVLVAPEGSDTLDDWIGFFSQVKGGSGRRKGILQVTL